MSFASFCRENRIVAIWISSIYCCRQAYFIGIFWEKRGRTNIDSDIHFTVKHISMFQCFNFSNNIWLKLQAWKRAWSSLFPVLFVGRVNFCWERIILKIHNTVQYWNYFRKPLKCWKWIQCCKCDSNCISFERLQCWTIWTLTMFCCLAIFCYCSRSTHFPELQTK